MTKSPIPFVLLDETETTYGVSIRIDGIDLSQFEKNPVMFYFHNDWNMPVGRWENVRKESGKLLADAAFDYDDDDKDVQRMIRKVEKGFIKMASCGLVDIEAARDLIDDEKIIITKCRLREASIVPIGGNHNAMRLFDKDGKEIELKDKKDTLRLADYILANIQTTENNMKTETLKKLNLADGATPEAVEAAVIVLSDEKAAADKKVIELSDEKKTLEAEKTALQGKLDAIELAEKTAKKATFDAELELALKDGRVTESTEKPGAVKQSWLDLYDKAPENAMATLKSLTPHQSASKMNLGDTGEGAFAKRQKEIEENYAKKH